MRETMIQRANLNRVARLMGLGAMIAALIALSAALLATGSAKAAGNEPYLVKDILEGIEPSVPTSLTAMNGVLYFRADDGLTGIELWKSDGTEAGTVQVRDIYPGVLGSGQRSNSLTAADELLFFRATDGVHGDELWRSDGSEAGTEMVKDINSATGSDPSWLTVMDGTLFFSASDGQGGSAHGFELWKSDGTDLGTEMVKDIRQDPEPRYSSYPYFLTVVDGTLFFQANDGTTGVELWKSDGTEGGTTLIKDIFPGVDPDSKPNNSLPYWLTEMNGLLYFRADDGVHGDELWTSDGTEAGTTLVKDIYPGSESSTLNDIIAVNGILYFSAAEGSYGIELWRSDGTEAGTWMVKDIWPGATGSEPLNLKGAGSVLYFEAQDGVNGYELWRSDGTEAGTRLAADIYPGSGSSFPSRLTLINDVLFFRATDDIHGYELWRGWEPAGAPRLVADLYPGITSSLSVTAELAAVGDLLFFAADNGAAGIELWALEVPLLDQAIYLPVVLYQAP